MPDAESLSTYSEPREAVLIAVAKAIRLNTVIDHPPENLVAQLLSDEAIKTDRGWDDISDYARNMWLSDADAALEASGYYALGEQVLALRAERDALVTERDLAIAHDQQPYPTADAYERACSRLERFRSALKEIASYNSDELRTWGEDNAADMVEIARTALLPQKEPGQNDA